MSKNNANDVVNSRNPTSMVLAGHLNERTNGRKDG